MNIETDEFTYSKDVNDGLIKYFAEIAHEANRSYCSLIGDNSQVQWKDAPEWQKKSAINGVVFHLNNREATPESSHQNWLNEKIADGWSHGPVKDVDLKQHPCFLPYECLPESQKMKDYIFRSVVHGLFEVYDV